MLYSDNIANVFPCALRTVPVILKHGAKRLQVNCEGRERRRTAVLAGYQASSKHMIIIIVQRSFRKILRLLCSSRGKTLMASQKILRTRVRKVWTERGFFMRFGPFFYGKRKAGQDKLCNFTLVPYCSSKSCKIQVPKLATKQQF